MRASMAIPGAFSPVEWNGTLLSDGGLLNNLPVDVVRDLCGDVVIAVWIDSEPPVADELTGALALIFRSLDVVVDANERESIASLLPSDVGIAINTGDIGSGDFLRMTEAIEIGRTAAYSRRSELAQFSVSQEEYAAWTAQLRPVAKTEPMLAAIDIIGLDRVNPDYVRSLIRHSESDAPVDNTMIIADVESIYSAGDFERVDYRLTGPSDTPRLEIRPIEKSWGPDFLHLDYGLATDFGSDLQALLRVDHTRTWVNRHGGHWNNTAQLGQRSILSTNWYQPVDLAQRYFVEAALRYENSLESVYLDGDRVARYYFPELLGQIDIGMNMGARAQLRVGIRRAQFDADLETGLPGLPQVSGANDTSIRVSGVYDTRDNVVLPTRGLFASAHFRQSEDWFGGEQDYELFEAVVSKSFKFKGNSLSVMAAGAESDGDLPPNYAIRLGGIRSFPGLRQNEFRGPSYWLIGSTYLWELAELQPLFGQSIYAGFRLTAGEMKDRIDLVDDGTLLGIATSLQGRTPAGAFLLSLGYVDNGALRLQFSLGRPLDEGSLFDEIF
jgi:NTE family protein